MQSTSHNYQQPKKTAKQKKKNRGGKKKGKNQNPKQPQSSEVSGEDKTQGKLVLWIEYLGGIYLKVLVGSVMATLRMMKMRLSLMIQMSS